MNMTKVCRRCAGTGNVGGVVLHNGFPGGCFTCDATGVVSVDKFIREIGVKGDFFGITFDAGAGQTTKQIVRGSQAAIESDLIQGCTIKAITEDQARKFFAKYGVSVTK